MRGNGSARFGELTLRVVLRFQRTILAGCDTRMRGAAQLGSVGPVVGVADHLVVRLFFFGLMSYGLVRLVRTH
jgi:hypothetical protein